MPKAKSKAGRKTKITEAVVRKLVAAFEIDCTVEEACRLAGISKPTYYDACKKVKGFLVEMELAQDFPLVAAKKKIAIAMKSPLGDPALALKFLERRQRERYTPKIINEHQGGVALTYNEVETGKAKTVEEAMQMAEDDADE